MGTPVPTESMSLLGSLKLVVLGALQPPTLRTSNVDTRILLHIRELLSKSFITLKYALHNGFYPYRGTSVLVLVMSVKESKSVMSPPGASVVLGGLVPLPRVVVCVSVVVSDFVV